MNVGPLPPRPDPADPAQVEPVAAAGSDGPQPDGPQPDGPQPEGPHGPAGGGDTPPPKQRLSEFLTMIALDTSRDRLSVADLLSLLEGRATAALLLLFAFPNALPSPPGTSGILGLPLVYLSLQMMLGHKPWLPRFIADRSMSREDFAAIMRRSAPYLARAEKLLVPRLTALSTPISVQGIGALCLALSVILILPIPLGNMLPAFAICILALGVLERDGAWIVGGGVFALLAVTVVWGVIWAAIKAITLILS